MGENNIGVAGNPTGSSGSPVFWWLCSNVVVLWGIAFLG